jgi:hypothetical protein
MAMERTWTLPGAYAHWTITLTTAPAEGALEPFDDNWDQDPLDRIGQHFVDIVELLECGRMVDEYSARGNIIL